MFLTRDENGEDSVVIRVVYLFVARVGGGEVDMLMLLIESNVNTFRDPPPALAMRKQPGPAPHG